MPVEKTGERVTVNVSYSVAGGTAVASAAERAYPDPPSREVAEPERFIHYYCTCWKDEDFARMYGLLHTSIRERMAFEKFKARYVEDAEFNAGLKDEAVLEQVKSIGSQVTWRVSLVFQNNRAKPRTATATLKKTRDGYRLMESGLIPVDLDDL